MGGDELEVGLPVSPVFSPVGIQLHQYYPNQGEMIHGQEDAIIPLEDMDET